MPGQTIGENKFYSELWVKKCEMLLSFNPFNPFIVICIHYKLRIAAAILDLKMTWCGLKLKKITTYW